MYAPGWGPWLQEGWDLLGWEGPPMPDLWAAVLPLHGGNLGKSPLGGNHAEVAGSQVLFWDLKMFLIQQGRLLKGRLRHRHYCAEDKISSVLSLALIMGFTVFAV